MNGGTCTCAHGGPARCPLHQPAVTADHAGEGAPWPCDDYRAPLTCWTVPSGRKTLICTGCRDAFPDGAETQALYQDALRERVEALAARLEASGHGIREVTGDFEDGAEYLDAARQIRALLAPDPSERA